MVIPFLYIPPYIRGHGIDFHVVDDSLFCSDTLTVAQSLIGCLLVTICDGVLLGGIICETEGYLHDDAASHSYKGRSYKNESMFLSAGHVYVYVSYGIYYCMNVVTAPLDCGEGVLLRACVPFIGISHMEARRRGVQRHNISNGPGKLTTALGVSMGHNGMAINQHGSSIGIYYNVYYADMVRAYMHSGTRIGISRNREALYRFYVHSRAIYDCYHML